jgi:formylglycine-generating enzyme required for sulfatase activity
MEHYTLSFKIFRLFLLLTFLLIFVIPANSQTFVRRPLKSHLEIHWIGSETAVVHIGKEVQTVLKNKEYKIIPIEVDVPLSVRVEFADKVYYYDEQIQFSSAVKNHHLYVWVSNGKVRVKQQSQEENESEIKKRNDALQEIQDNMILVEGGSFLMGCTKEQPSCEEDEIPVQMLKIETFHINRYEITQKQWIAVMTDYYEQFEVFDCDDCPAFFVSWNDVNEFIKRLNELTGNYYRLPTEAEWEYAARGGNKSQGYIFSGSNTMADVGWYYINSSKKVNQVGLKKPNELGLYDMTGNVYEWCSDWYALYGIKDFNLAPQGKYKVIRGGAWSGVPRYSRNSYRDKMEPNVRNANIGFRLAH